MQNWREVLIAPDTPILKAIEIIDKGAAKIALVADKEKSLLGTVTDGDIRRGILNGIAMDDAVSRVMNPHPFTARSEERQETILAIMKLKRLQQIPILDQSGHITGIELLENLVQGDIRDNWVVVMVGGLGTRLHPLTQNYPKPLLKVGSKPLLETILENFMEYGFRRFYFSVNYKSELIEEYFGDGSRWGVDIRYVSESRRLGTAGALSLLPEKPRLPLVVMNGDLLTKVNFAQLVGFHRSHNAQATMCVREYDFQVPYGVVVVDGHKLTGIKEKPVQHFFVNAGIYVLEPEVLELIPPNEFFDMPTLFNKLIELQCETTVFPLREYWIDIGRMDDYERANLEYDEIFSPAGLADV
ncbi:Nucleotidyl transferase domain protein [Acididesulfobacillus acetoxydans]|uniref:Mannose-1-phosphate guanyltransferase n=1 Tax=Acididesulfobacillus acetoxydans TaxID=1561005 RepID=A0A8S0WA67_9FIRM|nr:nucleotidyltransferase family protein [Acididesulfobacillus acetoxydans]CAA7603189.1 Nucleotidyl transferase domain protein [Acididesulfobacillus acetoxydans]CEJ07583.1 Mannose-1-phosphate guanyltransferase [Acididesulfobacillus acetoxydans]